MSWSRFVRASLASVVLVSGACSGRDPVTAATPGNTAPPVVVPHATATATASAPADDPKANLVALVCSKRAAPCELIREHDADRDAKKRHLSVALFYVGGSAEPPEGWPTNGDPTDPAASPDGAGDEGALERANRDKPSPQERDPGLTLDADGERFSLYVAGECFAYEYWRIVREGDAIVEADKIADICNDGNGAAGVGEDQVSVFPNEVHISRSGGSSWRWGHTTRYSLSPFVRRWSSSESLWTLSSNRE